MKAKPPMKFNIEESVSQTLERRFKAEIPEMVPDCCVDLLPRKSAESAKNDVNLVLFPKSGKIEALPADKLAALLKSRGVKTLGLLDSRCHVEMFVNENLDNLRREVMESARSYRLTGDAGNVNVDSCFFHGSSARYFAYTTIFQSYIKKQVEERLAEFLQHGGGIIAIQDRYANISRRALETMPEVMDGSVLFCDVSDYEIHIWVAADCGGAPKMFAPLVTEFINYPSDPSSIEFSIESVIAQVTKQYRLRAPALAILLDGMEEGEEEEEEEGEENREKIKTLLAGNCGKVVVWDKDTARRASLEGMLSSFKKHEGGQAPQAPRVNMTFKEWTHNYLIPATMREFSRKGFSFIAALLFFAAFCWAGHWFTSDMQADYVSSINTLQNGTARYSADYGKLRTYSEEFSQLGRWRGNPDISTQFSGVSSLLTRNNCLLIRSTFHAGHQHLPQNIVNEIGTEVERQAGGPLAALDLAGIWELEINLPNIGLNSSETRRVIIETLQEGAKTLFGRDTKALLVLNGEQENSMSLLKNDSAINAVLFVWQTPRV